jgi:hypothetical protein
MLLVETTAAQRFPGSPQNGVVESRSEDYNCISGGQHNTQ